MEIIPGWWLSFLAGVYAPLGAACVLPLYPGFLAFLASQDPQGKSSFTTVWLGIIVAAGILISMLTFGIIVVTLLSTSLSGAIGVVSPIMFGILAVASIFLILDLDPGIHLPEQDLRLQGRPAVTAFLFGFFFGLIILPCNAAPVAVLLALSTGPAGFAANLMNFFYFGLGMSIPLLVLAGISGSLSGTLLKFLTAHRRAIHLIAGLFMLGISLYYLLCEYRVQEWILSSIIPGTL